MEGIDKVQGKRKRTRSPEGGGAAGRFTRTLTPIPTASGASHKAYQVPDLSSPRVTLGIRLTSLVALVRPGVSCANMTESETLWEMVQEGVAKSPQPTARNFAINRQAQHLYHLLERFEAGIELTGTEVKSIRDGKVNLKDSYAVVKGAQAWLIDCHISPYAPGSRFNHDPLRDRRLLLHRAEIDKLEGRTREKGLTVVPTRIYLSKNLIKCELALAKGKKIYDHRETSRRRTVDRETEQAIREHRRRHQ